VQSQQPFGGSSGAPSAVAGCTPGIDATTPRCTGGAGAGRARGEHICPKCIRPGDLIDVLDVTLYVDKVQPYTHPAIVPAGQAWASSPDRPPHEFRGITLCQATFCPFEPVPGSALRCGCHIQRGRLHGAVLCPNTPPR